MDVNDKEGSERASHVLLEDPVAARNVHGFVGDHRDVHLAQAAVLARGVDPGEVAEVRVCGACEYLASNLLELLCPVAEGDDLGRADEGEVERVEEEDDVLALVVGEAHVFKLAIDDGSCRELWCVHAGLKASLLNGHLERKVEERSSNRRRVRKVVQNSLSFGEYPREATKNGRYSAAGIFTDLFCAIRGFGS
jgi:hypothetical protein